MSGKRPSQDFGIREIRSSTIWVCESRDKLRRSAGRGMLERLAFHSHAMHRKSSYLMRLTLRAIFSCQENIHSNCITVNYLIFIKECLLPINALVQFTPCLSLSSFPSLLVVLCIDDSLVPLAGIDFALEQDVNLTVGSVLHLRHVEVCQDEAEETGTSPDISTLAAKVCLLHGVSNDST